MTGATPDDRELLQLVARAFATGAEEPSPREVHELHLAVARRSFRANPNAVRLGWLSLRRPAAAALALVAGLGAGVAGAAAAGASLPAPLRRAAVAVGLPVDDGDLASAKDHAARLRQALEHENAPAAASNAAALRASMRRLDPGDRAELQPTADDLLRWADDLEHSPAVPAGASGGSGAPATSGSHEGGSVSTTVVSSGEDGGGGSTSTTVQTSRQGSTSTTVNTTTTVASGGGSGDFTTTTLSGGGDGGSGGSGGGGTDGGSSATTTPSGS